MKLARYRRVSSKKQVRQGESLRGQILKTDEWAKTNGHEIIADYVDEGFSGYKGYRNAYNHLLTDITDPDTEIEGVIVYAISRISRDLLILLTAIQLFEKHNINFYSVIENLPEDRSSYRLMIAITGAVSQNQSDVNAVFVTHRLNETAEQGFYTGGPPPYGYTTIPVKDNKNKKKRKKLAIVEELAPYVQKIYKSVLIGSSGMGDGIKKIVTDLNRDGIKHNLNNWSITSLGRMLHDTTYKGIRIYGKNRKENSPNPPIKCKCPAIVSTKLWDDVQIALVSRRLTNFESKGERSSSLLTSLLRCTCCKSNLIISTGKSGAYTYYKCSKKIKENINICSQKGIPKEKLEHKILEVISKLIITKGYLDKILGHIKLTLKAKSADDDQIKLSKQRQLAETKQGLKKLFFMISKEQIAADPELDDVLDDLKKKRNTLEEELKNIKRRTNLPIWKFGDKKINAFMKVVQNVLLSEDSLLTKSFLRTIIDRIEVSPSKLTMVGSNMNMMYAISKTKMGTSSEVPTFVSMWR